MCDEDKVVVIGDGHVKFREVYHGRVGSPQSNRRICSER